MATDTVTPTDGPTGASTSSASGYVQPEVDVPALTRLLDGRYAEVRNLVRSNLSAYSSILTDAETLSRADYRERVKELVVEMASTGQTGMGFPEEYGGGGDIGASIAAFETLSFGDLSVLVKVGVQFGLFGGAILQLGTERHHEAYLRRIVTGELMGCFAMTETGHGSNVQALGTVATYDVATQEFVITTTREDARKDYIGNAAEHGELAVVFAQLEVGGEGRGVHAFVARNPDENHEGVYRWLLERNLKLYGVAFAIDSAGDIYLDGRLPLVSVTHDEVDRLLGSVLAASDDSFNTILELGFASSRRQFEASGEQEELLLDYGMHQRRLLPLLARTYALHFAQDVLSANLHDVLTGVREDEQTQRELESRAAGTKALGTWHATRTIQECREACGGAGYLAENRFAALKADTDVFTTFEGDNHVLLQLVAKGLLTDYASDFEDMDQFGLVRFVAGLAVDTVVEKTRVHGLLERVRDLLPGGDEWDQEAGLLDPEYQLAMYRFREEHMISGAARRLKRGIDNDMDPGEVFSRVQDHVIGAARAHMERLVLEAFVERPRALPDGDLKVALNLLCDLHALSGIEADSAWFMEHGRLSVQRSKAIRREVSSLCRKVRPLAGDLVDAFGVPEEMLRSPELIGDLVPMRG